MSNQLLRVTAGDLREGDRIRISGASDPYEIESAHVLITRPGRPLRVEVVGRRMGGPPSWPETFSIQLSCDTMLNVERPGPPPSKHDKIDEFIDRVKTMPVPTRREDLRRLIVELATLVKEHAHTDGPDVNWTRPAAWREGE